MRLEVFSSSLSKSQLFNSASKFIPGSQVLHLAGYATLPNTAETSTQHALASVFLF